MDTDPAASTIAGGPTALEPAGHRSPHWSLFYWGLTAGFILSAALNLAGRRAGFLTNHLADLTGPAWIYVVVRGLVRTRRSPTPWSAWLGRSPERAAALLFTASAMTEISQYFWPHGIFPGRFDPWDILAYAVGLVACYIPDRLETNRNSRTDVSAPPFRAEPRSATPRNS